MHTHKNLISTSPRLQWVLLQWYDVIVWYHPSQEMWLVDAPSHLPSHRNSETIRLSGLTIMMSPLLDYSRWRQKQLRTLFYLLHEDLHWMAHLTYCALPEFTGTHKMNSAQEMASWWKDIAQLFQQPARRRHCTIFMLDTKHHSHIKNCWQQCVGQELMLTFKTYSTDAHPALWTSQTCHMRKCFLMI